MEPFPEVDTPPRFHLVKKIIVADVVYHSQGCGDVGRSHRYLQKRFNRCKRGSIRKLLRSLCDDEWLEVSRKHGLVTETHYRPGRRLSAEQCDRWMLIGERLFDPEGSLGPFLTRPAIKHGYLGISGLLVAGTLKAEGPVLEKDLVRCLAPLLVRTALVGSTGVLNRLVRSGVLDLPVDRVWCAPDDLDGRIRRYEVESGVGERVAVLHARIEAERKHHNEEVLGSPYLQAFRKFLIHQPCSKCGRLSGGSGGEVDHFPPIHSGGCDAVGRQYPICRSCNNKMSGFTKRTPTTGEYAVPVALTIYTDDPDDVPRFAQVLSDFMYLVHKEAFEDDDPEMSARGIAIADPLWLAANGFVEGAKIVDTTTGEINEIPPADDDKWHLPPRAR
jgi:hypothetical protein